MVPTVPRPCVGPWKTPAASVEPGSDHHSATPGMTSMAMNTAISGLRRRRDPSSPRAADRSAQR